VSEEIDEIVQKAKAVAKAAEEDVDPWKDFKILCSDYGIDYREVIDKAAWYYIEETGGVAVSDPVTELNMLSEAIEKFEEAVSRVNEPSSIKKLRMYKETFKELAEFKQAIKEFREGKITARDLIEILGPLLKG